MILLLAVGLIVVTCACFGAWLLFRDVAAKDDEHVNGGEPMPDDELARQLSRVGSDLRFRRWTRHRVKIVAILIAFDLSVSFGCVVSLVRAQNALDQVKAVQRDTLQIQREGCDRDNALREAYVLQWQPVLDEPPAPLPDNPTDADRARYEAGLETRDRFQKSLDLGFKQHPC